MFAILRDRFYLRILLSAILVRLLIMPFYFHPDIKTYNFQSSFLKNGVVDVYSYLLDNKEKLPLKEEFVYFPLTYFFLGSYQIIISPLLGSEFQNWLSDASISSTDRIGTYRYLLLLKLPFLILDILIAILLTSLFTDPQIKQKLFKIWLLNPFSVLLIYVFSNVDIFPVFLTVLSLYFVGKNKFFLSAISLGLGAGFKAYPLLLTPFLLMHAQETKQRLLSLFGALGVFMLIIAPFLGSKSFQQSTLTSGLTTRIISYGVEIGFGEILIPAIIFLSLLFFFQQVNTKIELWRIYLVAFLAILVFIHYHIQWLLWMMPFLTILFALGDKNEKMMVVSFLFVSLATPLLYSDKFMSVGLLSPINIIYTSLPTPADIVNKVYRTEVLQSILHSILIGLSVILSWRVLNKRS